LFFHRAQIKIRRPIMKKFSRAVIASSLALALTVGSAAPAFAAVIGDELLVGDTALNVQTTLSTGVYWGYTAADKRADNYITYTPNSSVTPIVAYGNYVTQTSTVSTAARALESSGYRVVAGTNGGYFETSNGVPVGLLVTRGYVASADSLYYAAGFKSDGSVVIGKPSVWMSLDLGLGDGVSRSVVALNKTRGNYGIYMYTANFNAASTTGTTSDGVDVVLSLTDSAGIKLGGTTTMTVDSVTDHTHGTKVESGKVVLTANYESAAAYTDALKALTVGSTVTLDVSAAGSDWYDVQYAVGSAYPLVLDGSVCTTGLSSTSNPYTAIGVKSDGTVVLYTIDGRRTGHSVGASQTLLAQRMAELGCVNALCLDGGGSTAMSVTSPASSSASLITSPSDGRERAVSNQIFFVASPAGTGVPLYCYVVPSGYFALSGAKIAVSANVVDTAYIPMSADVSLSASGGGDISGGVFTAPASSASTVITASGSGVTGSATITTVATPDSITIRKNNTAVSSLAVAKGASVALTASSVYNHMALASDNSCYKWAVTGNVGTVTPDGTFTATDSGSGTVDVTAGGKTVSIPVTVAPTLLNSSSDGVLIDSSMLSSDCSLKLGTSLDHVVFTQPDSSVGALYYNYTTSAKASSLVSSGTSYCISSEPYVSGVKFIPKAGYSGTTTIAYTGYDASGASYAGTITIAVASKTASSVFSDVGDLGSSWAADSVDFLYAYGIAKGQGDGVFGASSRISRGDFMLMLYRAFDLKSVEGASADANFGDVKSSAYYAEAIAVAKSLGIAKGSGGKFDPSASITRQDAMVLITRTMAKVGMTIAAPDANVLAAFSDASDISSYASDSVASLAAMGIVKGSKGAIAPKSGITRAEMACILHRVLANPF
jgi:exopolysaccharide biosynthesis protein